MVGSRTWFWVLSGTVCMCIFLFSLIFTNSANAAAQVSGTVMCSETNDGINGADVTITGPGYSDSTVADAWGNYTFLNVPPGSYTLRATKTGFYPVEKTITLTDGASATAHLVMSALLSQGYRIVLTWGLNPYDLDAHLWTPRIEGTEHHVYYGNDGSQQAAPYALLHDDDTYSYGPETITIYQTFPGTYTYGVHHFSGEGSLTTTSQANVKLYDPSGLIGEWNVPTSGDGSWWNLFDLNAQTGEVTLINTITGEARQAPDSWEVTLPPGTTAADYQIVSMPLQADDPSAAAVIGSQIDAYDPFLMRIGYWDAGTQSYTEYPFDEDIEPGEAGWFLFRNGHTLNVNGGRTNTEHGPFGLTGYYLPIDQGWNLAGNPYTFPISVSDFVVEESSTGEQRYLTNQANNITQRVFWVYNRGNYSAGTYLGVTQGGWIKKITSGGGAIFFPNIEAVADAAADAVQVSPDLERPPAPPGVFDAESTGTGAGGGSAGGGGGGCFINSAADVD